jgi:hypothetical protein
VTAPSKGLGAKGLAAVPRPALVLGLGGLVPFWAGAVVPLVLPDLAPMLMGMLLGYAAVILAFMGAVHWGLAMASPAPDAPWLRYGGSVVPPLVAWIALMLPVPAALVVFSAAFALLFAADLKAVEAGWAPRWYPALRRLLSVLVILALAVALVGTALRPVSFAS